MCPVCAVAVVGGLGISRALGVDDLVVSVWIGGLILSLSFWLINFLKKKKSEFPISRFQFPIILAMYAFVLIPLYYTKTIGIWGNTFWGVDKIIFGTAAGSVAFLKGIWIDKLQRKKFGKQFFNFQKVVFPVLALVILSAVFFLITNS